MAFYGGITPKHLDAVAFTPRELFGINRFSKHVSMLIRLCAKQKLPPLGYLRRALVCIPNPPQSADSGGRILEYVYRGVKSMCTEVSRVCVQWCQEYVYRGVLHHSG